MAAAPIQRDLGPDVASRRAAIDLLFVLGTLFAVKAALLRIDGLWTYAGPISLLASAAVATLRLRGNRESWADLGLGRPASIPATLAWSLAALVVTIAAGALIEGAISAAGLQGSAVDPRYAGRFAGLPGNARLFLFWVSMAWAVGAFAEEMLFRAMLFTRFQRLFAGTVWPAALALSLQAILFGQQHFYYQGWSGALATGGIGLVSGALYLLAKRNLWPLVLSHGAANTLGMTLIYSGLQPPG